METLYTIQNGNVHIQIKSDGTKIREYEGIAAPVTPESIDVKITDYCDAGCQYCHEMSTPRGKHADLDRLFEVLRPLPPGTEIAIGGGNPLSHPDLEPFLEKMAAKGIICNITVNEFHIEPYFALLERLIQRKHVYGVGISYTGKTASFQDTLAKIQSITDNVVLHAILGVNTEAEIEKFAELSLQNGRTPKILLLGYKQYGFGKKYYIVNREMDKTLRRWMIHFPKFLLKHKHNVVFSFDNLAIKQLELKRIFKKTDWDRFYMGDDFVFTMYIDAVKQQFAPSSTSDNRSHFDDFDLVTYFGMR